MEDKGLAYTGVSSKLQSWDLSPGLPSPKVLSHTPGRVVGKMKEGPGTQMPREGTPRYKEKLVFPSNPHSPKTLSFAVQNVVKFDV